MFKITAEGLWEQHGGGLQFGRCWKTFTSALRFVSFYFFFFCFVLYSRDRVSLFSTDWPGNYYEPLADPKLTVIVLLHPYKCWAYRGMPLCPARTHISTFLIYRIGNICICLCALWCSGHSHTGSAIAQIFHQNRFMGKLHPIIQIRKFNNFFFCYLPTSHSSYVCEPPIDSIHVLWQLTVSDS